MGTRLILLLYLYLRTVCNVIGECPNRCSCKRVQQSNWIKLRCGELTQINHLEELDLVNIAEEIIQLNLTHNLLNTFNSNVQFPALQKLDLSKNLLTSLQDNQFIQVPNLRRLDISGNNLKFIEPFSFTGLKQLERLKLNHNQLTTIHKGTFKPLVALKQLDISSNPLTCDCDLLWILNHSVKLLANPKCASPTEFKGTFLKKLTVGVDVHCKSTSLLEMSPYVPQVAFEGDTVQFTCTTVEEETIEWHFEETNAEFNNININVEENGDLITSILTLFDVRGNQSGWWSCNTVSNSKKINLIVVSTDTKFCPLSTVKTNRGTYMWPHALANHTVTQSCTHQRLDAHAQKVTYFCSAIGQWENLNISACSYTSEVTRILQQFSLVNYTHESSMHFRNYTSNLQIYKDYVDLEFTVRTLENYIKYLETDKELGGVLMDVISNLMNLPQKYIEKSNVTERIVGIVEEIAGFPSIPVSHKANVAAEEFTVKQEVFTGMTCSWYLNQLNASDRLFYCITSNKSALPSAQNRIIEASVQIPASLFYQVREQNIPLESAQKLLVVMYSNGKLFPIREVKSQQLSSPVVGIHLTNVTVGELIEPIYVMLKTPKRTTYAAEMFTPVWWNTSANNWSEISCELSHEQQETVVFFCNRLGYYGLLQNISHPSLIQKGEGFHWSHPGIHAGSALLFIFLFISILTYSMCYTAIQMPKKTKHSLINTWLSIILLTFMYNFGIYQTDDMFLCRIIGLLLHYLTLTPLFWMCVGVISMYKRLNKTNTIELNDDELPADQPTQKPILGLYLVGWGISMIICGISGAVNMREYAGPAYCYLRAGPAFSAIFVPASVIILMLFVLFLLIRCAIYGADVSGHLSEGTQVTENVDLDLLDASFPHDRQSMRSSSSKTRSSEVEDVEHGPATQLKAYVITLILYIMTWCACAASTIKPLRIKHEEEIFSIIYAFLTAILGGFTLFFYNVARNDVRNQWGGFRRWLRRCCFRSRNISDTIQSLPQIQPVTNPQVDLHVTSRSSSRSSNTKSNSNSNALRAVANLNTRHESPSPKVNNVNLVLLHRQHYRNKMMGSDENAQAFYNPYQSTVARKFFRRQRQNMLKRNNLMLKKCEDASDSSGKNLAEKSLFGTNSKVNNTNIHVEHVFDGIQNDPNILSDQPEPSGIDIPIERLMLNAERLRRRELGRHRTKKKQDMATALIPQEHAIMRTVSQQCSLEYSSDSISVPDEKSNLKEQIPILTPPRVFVNPSHGLRAGRRAQSRASSVSASELDELYQQIRKGPARRDFHVTCQMNSRLSDPEIRFSLRQRRDSREDDNWETNV